MKKFVECCVICFLFVFSVGATMKDSAFVIDASKNANEHNNRGVMYMQEFDYYAAMKEFEIAIQINPNTQASATYYNNLGKVYMKTGYYVSAEMCFLEAHKRNNANLEYYQNIVAVYKLRGKLKSELKRYMSDKKANSAVFAGLILIEQGKMEEGINMLDEFCFDEPEMILSKGVRAYIQEIAPKELRF